MERLDCITDSAYLNAKDKGFYDDYERVLAKLTDPDDIQFFNQIWLSHRLMLIVSELAEGLEAIREWNLQCAPKSNGLGEELSDVQVRLADLWRHAYPQLSLAQVTSAKMDFNATRAYKHNKSL